MDVQLPEIAREDVPPARLARLVEDLRIRLSLLREVAWDVNLLALSAHDATVLADAARRAGFDAAAGALERISSLLATALERREAADDTMRESLARLAAGAAVGLPALESERTSPDDSLFDLDLSEALPIGGNLAEYDGFDTESARSLADLSAIEAATLTLEGDAPEAAPKTARDRSTADLPKAPDWSIESESEPLLAAVPPRPAAAAEGRSRSAAVPGPDTGAPPRGAPVRAAVPPRPAAAAEGRSRSAAVPGPDTGAPPKAAPATADLLVDYMLAQGSGLAPATAAAAASGPAPGEARMAYLLAGETAFAGALEQQLAAAGFEVHRFADPEELAETVGALVPAVVLTAPDAFAGLETVAAAVSNARKRTNAPIVLITIGADGSIPARLAAMRAGADAFIAEPVEPAQVVSRLSELRGVEPGEPFRVLIVEDDRPQAVFAESILRKAGMQTRAVHDPFEAIDVLEEFDPELVLMDLRMPGCNGIELTTLIRERDRFVDVPIVFLSGEQSAERRYDALAVGGDDYLEKPIKPKFLLSAVTNRVRRARAVRRRGSSTGRQAERMAALYDRTRLIDRIGEALAGAGPTTPGAVLFLIVDGAQALRERLGLMHFDQTMQQAGAMLAESLAAGEVAARFGDSSFVVLAASARREEIAELAARLGRVFAERLIESESGSQTLAASIGIATFDQGWRDVAAMVNAAERAATRARTASGDRIAMSPGPGEGQSTDADASLRHATIAALAGDGLQLLYQPIASLQGGTDEVFQVLLRVRDDRGRRYSAAEIIPMAERNGLVDKLDRAVLARCAVVLGERIARGRRTSLVVSQSIHALADTGRFDWLRAESIARGVEPMQFVLELRHDDVVAKLAAAGAWLTAAREAGFRTSIGTFEPNPASMQSLQRLPLDLLRLSGRFIAQLDDDRLRMLADLVEAVHAGGTRVVAPMVEDARTAAMLWRTGVDCIQGDFVQSAGQDLEFDFRAATL